MSSNNEQMIIYSMRMMKNLIRKGFIPVATIANPKKKEFDAWIFKDTNEFRQALNELSHKEESR